MILLEEGIVGFFLGDGGGGAVAGVGFCLAGEGEEFLLDAPQELLHAAAGEVGPADGPGKERVADKGDAIVLGVQANPSRRVAGRVKHAQRDAGLLDDVRLL